MMFDEGGGWRNEDTEGPHIDTLRTFYDWDTGITYKIVREFPVTNRKFMLTWSGCTTSLSFDTIQACKLAVENLRKQK